MNPLGLLIVVGIVLLVIGLTYIQADQMRDF